MTKILYISHFKEPSGWGQAARDYILAMDSVGINVVPRAIRPNKSGPEVNLPDRIKELESNDLSGATICIQHLLPHLMDYNGHFDRNIGLFVTETQKWHHSGWHHYLNLMDEVWVPNNQMLESLKDNKINIKGSLVPHACNINKYLNPPIEKLDIDVADGNYKFYFIGEYNRRKRISAIIQAYFMAFTRNDPVSLILKLNKFGVDPQEIYNDVVRTIDEIKRSHKLHMNDNYPNIVIMPHYMSEQDIQQLHITCNCFVNASFGEAWSIPTFDAMGYGNQILYSQEGGPKDFLNRYNRAIPVDGQYTPVFGMTETFQQLNTAKETWFNIDINQLAKKMKLAEKLRDRTIPKNNLDIVEKYSYQAIGQEIKNALCI